MLIISLSTHNTKFQMKIFSERLLKLPYELIKQTKGSKFYF